MKLFNFKLIPTILFLFIVMISIFNAFSEPKSEKQIDQASFDYLKALEGKWVVHSEKEGTFGWEFNVTSRGSTIIEKLKAGTTTEMMSVYILDEGILKASHYCQLQNQPHLIATSSDIEGDLHFICDGDVGNTKSHDELHMHGVHFQKKGDNMLIWMDMFKNGEVAFQTTYLLVRTNTKQQ